MSIPKLKSFKNKSSSIVVFYSTKDRLDYTKITSQNLLSNKEIDLIWLDGSETEMGKEYPNLVMESSDSAYRLYQNVVGGPDIAIMFALDNFLKSDYELMVLIENDVLMLEGWLYAIKKSIYDAEAEGFQVGGASARVYPNRILAINSTYNLLLNSGAGCIALRQNAAKKILKNYGTIPGDQLMAYFDKIQNNGLVLPACNMSADWSFEYLLYNSGLVVTSPQQTYAKNIDQVENYTLTRSINAIQPKDIQENIVDLRFSNSNVSGRQYISIQHLNFGMLNSFINFFGEWKRQWNGHGPFNLIGKGVIEAKTNSKITFLGQTIQNNTEIEIISSDNNLNSRILIKESCLFELPVKAPKGKGEIIFKLKCTAENIIFYGIITSKEEYHMYLNDIPGAHFLTMPHEKHRLR